MGFDDKWGRIHGILAADGRAGAVVRKPLRISFYREWIVSSGAPIASHYESVRLHNPVLKVSNVQDMVFHLPYTHHKRSKAKFPLP